MLIRTGTQLIESTTNQPVRLIGVNESMLPVYARYYKQGIGGELYHDCNMNFPTNLDSPVAYPEQNKVYQGTTYHIDIWQGNASKVVLPRLGYPGTALLPSTSDREMLWRYFWLCGQYLHLNCVRINDGGIYNTQQLYNWWNSNRAQYMAYMTDMFDMAYANGVYIVFCFIGGFYSPTAPIDPTTNDHYFVPGSPTYNNTLAWIGDMMTTFKNHPGLGMWDLFNEPDSYYTYTYSIAPTSITGTVRATNGSTTVTSTLNNGNLSVAAVGRNLYVNGVNMGLVTVHTSDNSVIATTPFSGTTGDYSAYVGNIHATNGSTTVTSTLNNGNLAVAKVGMRLYVNGFNMGLIITHNSDNSVTATTPFNGPTGDYSAYTTVHAGGQQYFMDVTTGAVAGTSTDTAGGKVRMKAYLERLVTDAIAYDHTHPITVGVAIGSPLSSFGDMTTISPSNADVWHVHPYYSAYNGNGTVYNQPIVAPYNTSKNNGKPLLVGEIGYNGTTDYYPPYSYWKDLYDDVFALYPSVNVCWMTLNEMTLAQGAAVNQPAYSYPFDVPTKFYQIPRSVYDTIPPLVGGAYKYSVSLIGGLYTVKNASGTPVYSNASAALAINYAMNNLTVGRTSKEKVQLQGNFTLNAAITPANYSILDATGCTITWGNALDNMIYAVNKNNFEIVGGVWNKHMISYEAFAISSCTDVIMSDLEVTRTNYDCVSIGTSQRVTISNCSVHYAFHTGIVWAGCSNCTLEDSHIYDCGVLDGVAQTADNIYHPGMEGGGGSYFLCDHGIVGCSSNNNVMRRNTVERVYLSGLSLCSLREPANQSGTNNLAEYNVCIDCGRDGYHPGLACGWGEGIRSTFNTIRYNEVYETGTVQFPRIAIGIQLSTDDSQIYNNNVHDVADNAIQLSGNRNIVHDNTVTNMETTYYAGIYLMGGSNNDIYANTITHCTRGVSLAVDPTSGVNIYATNNTIHNNRFINTVYYTVYVDHASNIGNTIENNTYKGLWLIYDADTNTFRNNTSEDMTHKSPTGSAYGGVHFY